MDRSKEQLRLELGDAVQPPLPPEISKALDELLGMMEAGEPRSPFDADCQAAAVAATFRLATSDPTLAGAGDEVLDLRSNEREAELDELRVFLVAGLGVLAERDHDQATEALQHLAVYGGPFESSAAWQLEQLAATRVGSAEPTVAVVEPTRATVVSALLVTTIPGDTEEIILELAYPDHEATTTSSSDGQRVGIAVMLDTFAGRRPVDALICDDLDEFEADMAEAAPDLRQTVDVRTSDAIALLAHALWLFDHTIGAADHLEEDSDFFFVRPLLDQLIARHPHDDYVQPEVGAVARDDAVAGLLDWVDAEAPDLLDLTHTYAGLLVDFAADQAGDPLRWSPIVSINFLHMACHKVLAPPEELAVIPDIVRLMIRWSHREKDWPTTVTDDTLAVVDEVQPLFDAELHGIDNQQPQAGLADVIPIGGRAGSPTSIPEHDLLEPPIGGTHPETFDLEGIPDGLHDRAKAVASEAAHHAAELFDPEFATLVNRFTADAARHPDTPFARGKTSILAAGVVYAVAQLNEIPGGWSPLARPAAEITDVLDGVPTTITNKAKALRDLLGVDHFPPEPRYQHSTSVADTAELLASTYRMMGQLDAGFDLAPELTDDESGSVEPPLIGADCFVLRVSLADTKPEIWRRVRLPVEATFAQLHTLLQISFGWYDAHLHNFDLGTATVGPVRADLGLDLRDTLDEAKLRLLDAIAPGSEFAYVYDFGDNWEHRIVVEGVEDIDARADTLTGEPMGPFALLGGAMAGPPEDCGGPFGYADLLQAMRKKNHPRRDELAEWLPPGFNPKHFDAYTLNGAVQRLDWQ